MNLVPVHLSLFLDILMVAEGLDLIKVEVPKSLIRRTISESSIRKETSCTIIAVNKNHSIYSILNRIWC